jgi:hypothetical protein
MCHHYTSRDSAEREHTDEEPSFLNEDATAETELLTDGGDEAEDDE